MAGTAHVIREPAPRPACASGKGSTRTTASLLPAPLPLRGPRASLERFTHYSDGFYGVFLPENVQNPCCSVAVKKESILSPQGQTAQKTGVFGTLSPSVAPSENGPSAPTKLRIAQ